MDLPSVINAANNVANEARSTFGHLSPSQLNWKPSAERWSVAQCFEHLLTSNKGYLPIIDNVIYSLMDAYRLIVVHEQRHFQQAKRVIEETGFPS